MTAVLLCACALAVGAGLGWLARGWHERRMMDRRVRDILSHIRIVAVPATMAPFSTALEWHETEIRH